MLDESMYIIMNTIKRFLSDLKYVFSSPSKSVEPEGDEWKRFGEVDEKIKDWDVCVMCRLQDDFGTFEGARLYREIWLPKYKEWKKNVVDTFMEEAEEEDTSYEDENTDEESISEEEDASDEDDESVREKRYDESYNRYYLRAVLCVEIRTRVDRYDKRVVVPNKRGPATVEYLRGWLYNEGDRWVRNRCIKYYRDPSSLVCYNHYHRTTNNNKTVAYVYIPRSCYAEKNPVTINNRYQPRYVCSDSYDGMLEEMYAVTNSS